MIKRIYCKRSAAMAFVMVLMSGWAAANPINQVPNPEFRGTAGAAATDTEQGSTVSGVVPTLWRAFAVGGGALTVSKSPAAADAIFPGSPVTNVMTVTVDVFGGDQGFDTSPVRFSLDEGRAYQVVVYLRSNAADSADQSVTVSVPVFDQDGMFTGRAPGSIVINATSEWTRYEGPIFTEAPNTSAEVSFRLNADGADDSIQIALPTVAGVALANQSPNPRFSGNEGVPVGNVAGTLPDGWRGFAIEGGDATFSTEPVAANELYPGSPATTAVRMTINAFGTDQGFDNEISLHPIVSGRQYYGQVYLRSGNSDRSNVSVGIGLNGFSQTAFVPPFGLFTGSVGPDWGLYATSSARMADEVIQGSLAIRMLEEGVEHSVLIALPQVLGPDEVFASNFEPPPPLPGR